MLGACEQPCHVSGVVGSLQLKGALLGDAVRIEFIVVASDDLGTNVSASAFSLFPGRTHYLVLVQT